MSENDLVYKCADAYQKGGIKSVIAEVREHDGKKGWMLIEDCEDNIAKTIERVLEAAVDSLDECDTIQVHEDRQWDDEPYTAILLSQAINKVEQAIKEVGDE